MVKNLIRKEGFDDDDRLECPLWVLNNQILVGCETLVVVEDGNEDEQVVVVVVGCTIDWEAKDFHFFCYKKDEEEEEEKDCWRKSWVPWHLG